MLKRIVLPAALALVSVMMQACSSDTSSGAGSGGNHTGGTTSVSGGSSANGGNQATGGTVSMGGAAGSGGTTAASGGATTAKGGATAASGGTTTAKGGATTASGGTNTSGGATTASGGATTTSGGATTTSGGATTASGGLKTGGAGGSGGATTASGGSTIAAGGATVAGGTTGTGGKATGGVGPGGATGTGGATTGTGGTTGGTAANEFWVSPTGDDSNPGTKDSPMFSVCWDDSDASPAVKQGACYKICPSGGSCLASGATIWVMDGTYKYTATQKIGSTKLGTAAGPYNVFAVAGAKPVFDFSALPVDAKSRGIQVQGDYWHVKGITVTKAGDAGIFVMGNNNTIEQCISHANADMGIAIGVNSSRSGTPANNLILNCDSYQNNDTANGGENADGFGAKKNTGGSGNVFRGCRAWDNSDDGFDFYGWAPAITVDNCWAVSQC